MYDNCKICYKKLPMIKHNRQVYCSDVCIRIGKETSNRVASQRKVYERLMKGIPCERCKKKVYKIGMRKYCEECSKIMNNKKICIDCGAEHSREKTDRCMKCATERKKEQIRVHNAIERKNRVKKPCRGCGCKIPDEVPSANRYCSEECKEANKPKKPKKVAYTERKEINPMFLKRGKISGVR